MRLIISRFILFSILTIVLWFYSNNGGLSIITIKAQGSHLQAYLDNRLIASLEDNTFESGKIYLDIYPKTRYFSFSNQKVISAIIKTVDETKNILANEECKQNKDQLVECGLDGEWKDFELKVTCQACHEVSVRIREQNNHQGYVFWGRTWLHGDYGWKINSDLSTEDKTRKEGVLLQKCSEIFKSILSDVLPSMFAACFLLGILSSFSLIRRLFTRSTNLETFPNQIDLKPTVLISLTIVTIATISFFWVLHLTTVYLESIPHVQDSAVYWFQAKIFAKGWLYAPAPPSIDHFSFPFMWVVSGKWFSQYPFGWPLALALGHLIKAPWLIPAFVGFWAIIIIYRVTVLSFGTQAAIWAAILLAISPWYQMMSSNFMSHSYASLWTMLSLPGLLLLTQEKALKPWLLVAGFSIGMLFNIRPLTAVAIMLPFILEVVLFLLAKPARKQILINSLFFSLSCIPIMLAYFVYNWALTGSAFKSTYDITSSNQGLDSLIAPFGALTSDRPAEMLTHLRAQLCQWKYIALSIPSVLCFTLFFICLSIYANRKSILLAASILTVFLAYSFHPDVRSSIMYGPRYVYEVLPLFIILSACGLHILLLNISQMLYKSIATYFIFSLLLLMCCFHSLNIWIRNKNLTPSIDSFTPLQIDQLSGFNGIHATLAKVISTINEPSILFIPESSNWHPYGHGFFMNDPDLINSKVWIVRDLGAEKNSEIIKFGQNRRLLTADHTNGQLKAYRPSTK